MAKRHTERNDEQDDPNTTNEPAQDDTTEEKTSVNRRTFVKAVGAAAALGGTTNLAGKASAISDVDAALSPSGEVTLDPGEYSFSGDFDIDSGDALIGGGDNGDVVLNLDSGTMNGNVRGRLENVVVRGANPSPKAGLNVYPGATIDGLVWPEGGQQDEDRALYSPEGGSERATIRNSAWGMMANNGAYVDKPKVTMENCAAVNNNIAGIRVGHRRGTDESETTYIRNCLVAVTGDIPNDVTNVPNARGIRLRQPAHLVIENCWIVYLDVSGGADLIELHDGAAGSTVEIRNCAFYNDSDGDLVRDKSGGQMDVTIEDCVVAGSGSRTIEPDYDGNGVVEADNVDYPLPSEVTGYAAADEVEGFDPEMAPWNGGGGSATPTNEDTLVLHSSPDNTAAASVSFTVAGTLAYASEAEEDTDTIVDNGDGTMTATSVDLSPDELDSYRYTGDVVDYDVPDSLDVDVSVNGTTTTFSDLLTITEGNADVVEVIARQSGGLNYEFVVDGSAELHETSSQVTAGNGDSVTDNGDGTVTVSGFTGNDGFGDAYLVNGQIQSFSWDVADYDFDVLVNGETVDPASFEESDDSNDSSNDDSNDDDSGNSSDGDDSANDDDSTDDSNDGSNDDSNDGSNDDSNDDSTDSGTETPHMLTVDGSSNSVTAYTFTVSGDVVRDADLSEEGTGDTNWAILEDFARDGKVIGLVGSGVDVYRFGGEITEITVDGDAAVSIERNA